MSTQQDAAQTSTDIAAAIFPGSLDEAIAMYNDFNNGINRQFEREKGANPDLTREDFMAAIGDTFIPYLGEFEHGNIESALGAMAAALLGALKRSIPARDINLRPLRDQIVLAAEETSMWTDTPEISEDQFRAIEPILRKTYEKTQETNIAIAKSILTGIAPSIKNPVVQALAGNDSFIRFALYFALDAKGQNDQQGVFDINISPINWTMARRGRILPLTMISKKDAVFPEDVQVQGQRQRHASSSLFPFSIALALFIGTAAFRVQADRTAEQQATIEEQSQEIRRLMELPEVVEAQRRQVVAEQLDGTAPLSWLLGIFERACNSRVPPPAGLLESFESFEGGYTASIQYGYAPLSAAIVTNPLTNILKNAQIADNPTITEFIAQYNDNVGIPEWRAIVLGVNGDNTINMKDFRTLDLDDTFAAAPNGFIIDSDGDIVARRTLIVTLPFMSNRDGTYGESVPKLDENGNQLGVVPLFRAQRGALCIIAALGRALNCLDGFTVQREQQAYVDDSEPDTLKLMREILGLSMVSPYMPDPLATNDEGYMIGFKYVLSLPVLVDDEFGNRIKAFIDAFLPGIMDINDVCSVEDIRPDQIGISFAPTYTTCVGRNLVPELTRILASIIAEGNALAGIEDSRGGIEQRLFSMLEINEGQAGDVQGAFDQVGEAAFEYKVFINAGDAFSRVISATDLDQLARAMLTRISMQQTVSTPPVRPPVHPFAPLFYVPPNVLYEASKSQWISNDDLPFEDDPIEIDPSTLL